MVDTYIFKNDLAMLFWLVIALVFFPSNYLINGVVVNGSKLGRKLGFPTANLKIVNVNREMDNLNYGVYGAVVTYRGQKFIGGVSYGTRPTVEENSQPVLEVHIIGFDEEIYGDMVEVELVNWIRPVFKFRDLEELKANQRNDLKLIQAKIRI